MAEGNAGTNARRRARRNKSAASQRGHAEAARDRELVLDLDVLARSYGIDLIDFAEVHWDTGKPKLHLRGRRDV